MTIFSFVIVFYFANLVNSEIFNVSSILQVELQGAFPANAFNRTCVSSSCPNLDNSKVCTASGSSYDLNATIAALNECSRGTVCGIKIEPRPILFVQFSLNQLLQGVPLTGVCKSTPNCAYTNVIPHFNILSDTSLAMSFPKLSLMGDMSCQVRESVTSSQTLSSVASPPATIGFIYTFNYSSLVMIIKDYSDGEISIDISNPQLQVTSVNFNGLQFPSFPGIPDYLPTFKTLVIDVLEKMGLATFLGDFYKSLLQSALQVAQDYCNH